MKPQFKHRVKSVCTRAREWTTLVEGAKELMKKFKKVLGTGGSLAENGAMVGMGGPITGAVHAHHSTFSLNLSHLQGKHVLFIGRER